MAAELHAFYVCLVTAYKKTILKIFGFRTGAWGLQLEGRQCQRGQGLWQKGGLFPAQLEKRQRYLLEEKGALGAGLLDKSWRRVRLERKLGFLRELAGGRVFPRQKQLFV